MSRFVVLDTETTWTDEVMSVGAVVAGSRDFSIVDSRYYLIDPAYRYGGMYSSGAQVAFQYVTVNLGGMSTHYDARSLRCSCCISFGKKTLQRGACAENIKDGK